MHRLQCPLVAKGIGGRVEEGPAGLVGVPVAARMASKAQQEVWAGGRRQAGAAGGVGWRAEGRQGPQVGALRAAQLQPVVAANRTVAVKLLHVCSAPRSLLAGLGDGDAHLAGGRVGGGEEAGKTGGPQWQGGGSRLNASSAASNEPPAQASRAPTAHINRASKSAGCTHLTKPPVGLHQG